MDFETRFADKVLQCERVIGYSFDEKALCAKALNTAADGMSFYRDGITTRQLPKNDRLAVYGNIAATMALCRRWYDGGHEKGMTNRLLD